jgi:hypothetical protein
VVDYNIPYRTVQIAMGRIMAVLRERPIPIRRGTS